MNRWVRREVREQLHENPVARRVRYSFAHRTFRRFFGAGTFIRFAGLYVIVNVIFVLAEAISAWLVPHWLPTWTASGPPPATDIKVLMLNVSSYLLGAQIGLLGVVSLSLALVTLIAQREGSATDVQVYYHESFSFELVASCVSLAAVLCAQLLWPMQFFLHRIGFGTDLQFFKLVLISLHTAWLLVNLSAVAYFIATTFRFVQQSEREDIRERYTANIILPLDLTQRLREQIYGVASKELLGRADGEDEDHDDPSVTFGFDYGHPRNIEVETIFKRPAALYDVRMTWVRWALARWSARCIAAASTQPNLRSRGAGHREPRIWFTLQIDQPITGRVGWCQRRGGVPLTAIERFVLRHAFRFRSSRDAE